MNRRTVPVYNIETWRKLLIGHLTKGMSKTDDAYKMIVKGVECLDNHGLHKMCVKLGLTSRRRQCYTAWPIEIRYIIEMRQFGMDHQAVLEMLQDEYPNLNRQEICAAVEPYKVLAQQWYSNGDDIIHGVVTGWVAAAVNKN